MLFEWKRGHSLNVNILSLAGFVKSECTDKWKLTTFSSIRTRKFSRFHVHHKLVHDHQAPSLTLNFPSNSLINNSNARQFVNDFSLFAAGAIRGGQRSLTICCFIIHLSGKVFHVAIEETFYYVLWCEKVFVFTLNISQENIVGKYSQSLEIIQTGGGVSCLFLKLCYLRFQLSHLDHTTQLAVLLNQQMDFEASPMFLINANWERLSRGGRATNEEEKLVERFMVCVHWLITENLVTRIWLISSQMCEDNF